MPETNTTKPAAKKVAIGSSALAAIFRDLDAIDLSTAKLPDDAKPKRCSHYRELGIADDYLKRVILLRIDTVRALKAQRQSDHEALGRRIEEETKRVNDLKPDDYNVVEELKGVGKLIQDLHGSSPEASRLNTRLGMLNQMMRAVAEEQFSELLGQDFSVGPDFMIGFADHSNLGADLGSMIFDDLPDGISIEVVSMGSPFGERRSGDLFGSLFGRGGRRGFDILDLLRPRH